MKKVILILSIVFLTSGICSCKSVKKDKTTLREIVKSEETKKEVESVKEEAKSEEKTTIKETDQSTTIIEEKIIEKEGVKETTRKTTIKANKEVDQKTDKAAQASKEVDKKTENAAVAEVIKKDDKLNIDKKPISLWNLAWLLLPVGLYFAYRKFKNKIWWV